MTGQLFLNEKNHLQLDTQEIETGVALEVLIVDGTDNRVKWIETTVEYGIEGYYLTNLLGYSPIGLFAKIK
ncbi:hypothetical protein EOM81_09040 [bacterium]|nr:hypothetical protein [bacterium]